MLSGETPTEMVSVLVAVRFPESVTCTVKVKLPLDVGVPLITPLLDMESPGGSDPVVMVQVNSGVPPMVTNDWE